ncbi:restriction endonuclease subunit S [Prevotella sp.]|mgnify:CR=1 FL=1|nr:restriction endonuclease subunit S [Prevotella sp.]
MSSYYEKILATGEVKCIDEEIPFEVPKGWEWCRFSSLYLSLTDGTHSTPKYTLSGIPFISVKDMSSGVIDFSNTKYISKEEHQKLSDRCHPQKGDLLLSKVGTTGIPAMVTTDREFSLFVSVALIKLIQCDINREFLVFMIQSPLVQEQAKENTRGVGNKNWVLSAVSKTLMVVPPLEEQGRIKNRLNLILSYVERYSSSQDKLDLLNANIVTDLKKSILQEAIQGKLVPQIAEEGTAQELLEQIKAEKQKLVKEGILKKSALNDSVVFRGDDNRYCEKIGKSVQCIDEEIPFEIPESWVWCKFQDIANSELGKTMNKASDKGSEVPYLCSINVYWDKVDLSNVKVAPFSIAEKEKYLLQKGDLLICEGGEVGRCAIWSNDKTMYYQNALHRVRFYGNISSKFIQNVIRSYKTMGIIDKNSKGMTIKHFTKTALNSLYIPLPPFQEQQRIVAQIEKLFEQLH